MKWLLSHTETIISPLKVDEVMYLIDATTKELHDTKNETKLEDLYKFNGYIHKHRFQISKLVKYPQNFMPKIDGEVESCKKGCLLYLNYSLFRGTKFLLLFWTLACFFISSTFYLFEYSPIIMISSAVLIALNYAIAVVNFTMHLKEAKALLQDTLSIEK